MIDIWKFSSANKLKIKCIMGGEYSGTLVCITDTEEMSEEEDRSEDTITIESKDGFISFKPSEIESIEVLN